MSHPNQRNRAAGSQVSLLRCLQSLLPLVLPVTAIILGTAPSLTCETLQFTQVDGHDGHIILAGPISYRTKYARVWNDASFATQECRQYDRLDLDFDKDSKTATVWAFSLLAPLLGACLIIKAFWDIFSAPCRTSYGGSKCMGFSYLVTAVMQGLILLISTSSLCFDNPALQYLEATNSELAGTFSEDCETAAGFHLQIAATVLWILAALPYFLGKAHQDLDHAHPRQEQTVTYIQKKDGTIEEANVVVEQAKK